MGNYRLYETTGFQRELTYLAKAWGEVLVRKLHKYVYPQLRQEPHFGPNIKRMKTIEPTVWRYRIGDYRLFYHLDEAEKIVFLDTIEHRREAYR